MVPRVERPVPVKRGSGRRVRALYSPMPFTVQVKPGVATSPGGFAALMQSVEHEVLAPTFWFNPASHRKFDSVSIRLSGQRIGVVGQIQRGDQFEQDEKVEQVVAGTGPISLTARVFGINPGEWMVTAKMLNPDLTRRVRPMRQTLAPTTESVHPAAWSWRSWKLSEGAATPVKTTWLPLIRVPGVIPGFWTAMAVLGFVVALAVQALVISGAHLNIDNALAFSLFASTLGVIGAKVWFVVLRRRERRVEGWCIQGLLAGVGVAAAVGFVAFHIPVGLILDASTPGLFFGMAIGRVGCFFGGCCAGRPTASRWGIWSVLDQRVGMRRLPVQLLEALLALGVGLSTLDMVLTRGPMGGAIFVAGLAFYTFFRQGILRLRGGAPKSSRVAQLTAAAAAFVLAADLLAVALDPAFHIA
jgi:phosphatidylglycerol:prolipoprotein diacylglycerol transferase